MARYELPSGNWVELRDARGLKRRDKKAALGNVTDPEKVIAAGYEMSDGLLALLITGWSYELPLPSLDITSLDELPFEDDDALMGAIRDAQQLLFPAAATPDDHTDPKAPTQP